MEKIDSVMTDLSNEQGFIDLKYEAKPVTF
jgi:hypothetical protein